MRNAEQKIDTVAAESYATSRTSPIRVTAGNRTRPLAIAMVVLMAGIVGFWAASGLLARESGSADDETVPVEPDAEGADEKELIETAEDELTGDRLRDLFRRVGGVDGLELARAEGAFDLVRFDPLDNNKLLASRRRSYGPAENQDVNEIWELDAAGRVNQSLWAPDNSYDFAHYNEDGSVTIWTHGGGSGFAPRRATVLGTDGSSITTSPIYASRFAALAGTVFALTGNGDYYTNEPGYEDLVVDTGSGPVSLADGSIFDWIDTPTPDILVAYPSAEEGVTVVWDTQSLAPLLAHPLAGRSHQRIAVSGDGTLAVGATNDGQLEIIDLTSGRATGKFGQIDVRGIDQPISLNEEGTIAVTVERNGRVSLWWVGDETPIFAVDGASGQPRWVSAGYSPLSASAVAKDASRIALQIPASPDKPTTWLLLNTDVDSWIGQAPNQIAID